MQRKIESATIATSVPPLIRKNTVYVAIVLSLQGLGGQLAVTMGALMVIHLLGRMTLVGIGGSILGAGRMLMSYPMGKLTDARGRKLGMTIAFLLSLIGGGLLGSSVAFSSFLIFVVGMVALGLGVGSARQLSVAAVDMYPSARRAEGLGYVLTASIGSAIIAPLIIWIGEAVASSWGGDPLGISWYLMLVALAPTMLFIRIIRPDPKIIALNLGQYWTGYKPILPKAVVVQSSPISKFLRDRPKRIAYICYAAAQGAMSLMMIMTPVVLSESGHAISSISITVSIHVLGMFAFSIPLGKLADRIGRKSLIGAGLIIEAAGAFLVPITPSYAITTIGLFLIGIGWSAVNISVTALLADTTEPEERGRAIGLNETLSGLLTVVMPFIGGFIVELAGLTAVSIFGGCVVIFAIVQMVRLRESNSGQFDGYSYE